MQIALKIKILFTITIFNFKQFHNFFDKKKMVFEI